MSDDRETAPPNIMKSPFLHFTTSFAEDALRAPSENTIDLFESKALLGAPESDKATPER